MIFKFENLHQLVHVCSALHLAPDSFGIVRCIEIEPQGPQWAPLRELVLRTKHYTSCKNDYKR